mmetsp:Transcript_30946/g.67914  ORF Transcript_30946/g.67914 Transcript_30946/m.67914 type:complete len:86 (-) Transcript_30946:1589-1846(-)
MRNDGARGRLAGRDTIRTGTVVVTDSTLALSDSLIRDFNKLTASLDRLVRAHKPNKNVVAPLRADDAFLVVEPGSCNNLVGGALH